MKTKLRVLPAAIFIAILVLSLKVGDIWQSVTTSEAVASTAENAPGPRNPFADAARTESFQIAQANVSQAEADQGEIGRAEMSAEAREVLENGRFFEPETLQLAQAASDGPPLSADTDGAFDAFSDGTPEGFVGAETTDEEDVFGDLASLTPGELRLLHDLAGRREQIELKEREIEEREALLRAAEQQLVVQQEKLDGIRQEIADLVARYDGEQDEEQQKLRQIYSAMKAKSAAAIFNDLGMDTLIGVVRGMSPRRLAPILAAMNPRKAQLLTLELAARENLPDVPN